MASPSTTAISPRRNSLPSSISIPHDELQAEQNTHDTLAVAAAPALRRRSSLKELSSTSEQNAQGGAPWCSLLPPKVALTKQQQALVQQARTAVESHNKATIALVGAHGSGKSALARHLLLLSCNNNTKDATATTIAQQPQPQCLWLHADTEWTLRASYIAVLRHYACETALGQQTTLQLAQQIATLVLQRSTTSSWTIVYDNVGVPAEQFFAQWSIPFSTTTNITTIITTCLAKNYQQWQQHKYEAFVVKSLPEPDALALLLNSGNALVDEDKHEEEAEEKKEKDDTTNANATTLASLLQGLPLALRMAGAQWHQLELSLPKYVETLVQYKEEYNQQQPPQNDADTENLDWFWSFAIHQVWELSYNQDDYHQALIVASLLHRDYIPKSVFQPWSIVLLQLQAWHILQASSSSSSSSSTIAGSSSSSSSLSPTYYFSIPTYLQQAIRRRVPMNALCTAVEAVHGCQASLTDPIAFLPHLETLQANIDLLADIQQLPADFPRDDYAEVLLQTGLLLQRPPLADYPRAQKYFQQALPMVLPDKSGSSTSPTTNRKAQLAKALKYRHASIARLQGEQQQALRFSLEALQLYGYKDLEKNIRDTENSSDKEIISQPLPKDMQQEDWKVLSQLFHICGHASWKMRDIMDAKFYFQHELRVKKASYGPDTPQERLARTLNNLGSVCRECGDLPAAREYCVQSLEMQRALNKPDDLEMATTLNNLGALSYSLGDYTQAQQYFLQALDMKRKCYETQEGGSTQNQDIAETLHNLGMLSDHLGDYETAREYYQESLDCKYAVYGKDTPNADLATTLTSLGLLTMNHGQYRESQQYYQRALDMQRAVYKDDGNMEIVRTLHGLGILNYHLGKLQDSRSCHKEALKMQQTMENADQSKAKKTYLADPRTANLSQIMQNLGNLSHNVGEYEEAREFYEQGLQLYSQVCANKAKDDHLQRMLGNLQNLSSTTNYDAARDYYEKALEMKYFVYGKDANNSDLAFTLQSLALLNDNVGRYKSAQECYEKALGMLHHLYGGKTVKNGEVAGVLHGLGTVAFNRGNYSESGRYFQESLKMKETVYGGPDACNDDLATTHVSLGALAHSVGKYEDAKRHLEKALEMQQKVYGDIGEDDQNIEVAVTCNTLANLYRDLGQYDKALALYEKSAKHMGEDSDNPFLASMLTDFGELFRLQGDYDKADEYIMRARGIQQKLHGEQAENAEIAYTLTMLGKLYSTQGKHDKAQECLDKALKMQRSVFRSDEGETKAHGEVAETLEALGNLASNKGDFATSKKYLEEAEAMRQKMQGGDTVTVEKARTLQSLGDVETALGDEESAQKYRDDSESMHDSITELVSGILANEEQKDVHVAEVVSESVQREEIAGEPQPKADATSEGDEATFSTAEQDNGNAEEENPLDESDKRVPSPVDVLRSGESSNQEDGAKENDEESKSSETSAELAKAVSADEDEQSTTEAAGTDNAVSEKAMNKVEAENIASADNTTETESEGIALTVDTTPAIPPKSEKAVKKAAEKWKKNVKNSKKKRKEKEKSAKESKESVKEDGTKEEAKSEKRNKEKKLTKEKSKKTIKDKKKEKEDVGQGKEEKSVLLPEKSDTHSAAETVTTSPEEKPSKDDSETSYYEQATGECSDEARADSNKDKTGKAENTDEKSQKAEANGNLSDVKPQPAIVSSSRDMPNSEEEAEAKDPESSLPGKKIGSRGIEPVTDMPPRYPEQSEQASCGCWPFFSRR